MYTWKTAIMSNWCRDWLLALYLFVLGLFCSEEEVSKATGISHHNHHNCHHRLSIPRTHQS